MVKDEMKNLLFTIRSFISKRLGINDTAARKGIWWEVDLIIVLYVGSIVLGILAWKELQ
jgi:hypothetical protein